MSNIIRAYAAQHQGASLQPYEFDAGELADHEVEVQVEYCGVCHSDLSVIDNEWHNSQYPVVAGHEIIGTIRALGSATRGLKVGQRVGIGWTASSCQHCNPCINGKQHLCPTAQATIVGHAGGFAEKVRASWEWVIPLPDGLDAASAGPLLCGGITVFSPLLQHNTLPIHKVGVIGIGGLGHMAIKLFKAWGCEVTAFSSNPAKTDEIKAMGADHVVSSVDKKALKAIQGSLDLIVDTVNVPLEWNSYLSALAPEGKFHVSLMWMIDQAEKAGVKFDRNLINQRQYNQVNNPVVHDSVGGANGIPELSWLALGLVPTGMYFTPGRQVLWGETEGKTHGVAQRDKDKLAYLKLVWDQTLQFQNESGGKKFQKAKELEEYYIKTNMLQCRAITPIRCNPLQAYYDLKSAGLLSTGKSGKENNQVIMYNDLNDKNRMIQIQNYLNWINSNYQMSNNSLSTGIKP